MFFVGVAFLMFSVTDVSAHCDKHEHMLYAMISEQTVENTEEFPEVEIKEDEVRLLEETLNEERFQKAKEVYESYDSVEAYGTMKSNDYVISGGTMSSMPRAVIQLKE